MKLDTIVLQPGQTLQAKTETTGVLEVTAHYADKGAGGLSPGNQLTKIEGTSAVDIVSAPSSGSVRLVKTVSLFNNASGAALTTVLQINNGGTVFVIDSQSIANNAGVTTNE